MWRSSRTGRVTREVWEGSLVDSGALARTISTTALPKFPIYPYTTYFKRYYIRYVVSAARAPLESWRKIKWFGIIGIREDSVDWELVWKSPFPIPYAEPIRKLRDTAKSGVVVTRVGSLLRFPRER